MAADGAGEFGRRSGVHRGGKSSGGRAHGAEDFAGGGTAQEESGDGPNGTSCGDTRASDYWNAVYPSVPGSRRGLGDLAGVSCGAEVAGETMKKERRIRKSE